MKPKAFNGSGTRLRSDCSCMTALRPWRRKLPVCLDRPAPPPPSAENNSPARPQIRRGDQGEGLGVEGMVAARVVPPKGAPNVLLIMTDDDGFARRAPSAA